MIIWSVVLRTLSVMDSMYQHSMTLPGTVNSVFYSSVHLWRYRGGYPALTEVMNKLRQNKVRTRFIECADESVKPVDWCLFTGRSSRSTGRSGVRCCCLAGTSFSWSSVSGTSLFPERVQTSTSSDPTSSGWGSSYHVILQNWAWHTLVFVYLKKKSTQYLAYVNTC